MPRDDGGLVVNDATRLRGRGHSARGGTRPLRRRCRVLSASRSTYQGVGTGPVRPTRGSSCGTVANPTRPSDGSSVVSLFVSNAAKPTPTHPTVPPLGAAFRPPQAAPIRPPVCLPCRRSWFESHQPAQGGSGFVELLVFRRRARGLWDDIGDRPDFAASPDGRAKWHESPETRSGSGFRVKVSDGIRTRDRLDRNHELNSPDGYRVLCGHFCRGAARSRPPPATRKTQVPRRSGPLRSEARPHRPRTPPRSTSWRVRARPDA